MEILQDLDYYIGVQMEYVDIESPLETVWGSQGSSHIIEANGTTFIFNKVNRNGIRSSVSNGQIPILLYI